MDDINCEQYDILNAKIDNLETKLNQLLEKLDQVEIETQRMDSHITLIEGIYDKVKTPFHFLMRKTETFTDYIPGTKTLV